MIRTDESLVVQLKLLGNVERALDSLRADVEAKNPRNFAIFAEAYIDEINMLRAQIDEYLAWKKAKPPETNATPTPVGQQRTNVP